MESNRDDITPAQAAAALDGLAADRDQVAERTRPPAWYLAAFAAVAGGWVATPAIEEGVRTGVSAALFASFVVLIALYPRLTGIRSRVGWGVRGLQAGVFVVVLALFSVSLGLAAGGLATFIAVPAVAAAALVLAAALIGERLRRRAIRRHV